VSESSLRGRLREATAQDHAILDARVAGWRIETPAGYAAFLLASAIALTPLELALERAGVQTWLPDWPVRARRDALAADLAVLGVEVPVFEPAFVPSPDFGAGLLYTLEGSRLGARVLARQARGAMDGPPLAYLTHGQGRPLWRDFLTWLESIPKVGSRTDAIQAGARYGFNRFSDAFEIVPSPQGLNVRTVVHDRV
jgi:heme oxygenase